MPVTKRLQDLPKDLDRKISADFNELLQEIHTVHAFLFIRNTTIRNKGLFCSKP